jgi:mono/diheme cytochrome c family protein
MPWCSEPRLHNEVTRKMKTIALLAACIFLGHASAQTNPGADAYTAHCAICHGDQREGILPAFPPLVGIGHQLTDPQITAIIHNGKGRMPAFPKLPAEELTALLHFLATPALIPAEAPAASEHEASLTSPGRSLFQQNCAFCHGRDAMGGETGPDLTRSKLVLADVSGDKISEVVRNGRPEKKMPAFNFSSQELLGLSAWIHEQVTKAQSMKGGRRGVDVADLQTGNVEAGRAYFNGPGGCASRYEGLQLERRMLYPEGVKSRVSVTLASGKKIDGILAYQDEFTIGLRDADGIYHSWSTRNVKFKVDAPVEAHVELFPKYTDDDVHNLMAYSQTLKSCSP